MLLKLGLALVSLEDPGGLLFFLKPTNYCF